MKNPVQFARLISQITSFSHGVMSEYDIRAFADTVESFAGEATTDGVDRLLSCMKDGRKIEAIKEYRALTGAPLKDAKDAVEKYWSFQERNAA